MKPDNLVVRGDVVEVLAKLGSLGSLGSLRVPCYDFKCIFLDPPDGIGLAYNSFDDHWADDASYAVWLAGILDRCCSLSPLTWCSIAANRLFVVLKHLNVSFEVRVFIWRYTFGQHNRFDFGNGYRPIIRLRRPDYSLVLPRTTSKREQLGDSRANPEGRVPDDVWTYSRICGNFPERRSWHPTQHPEALVERAILCSPGPILDLFSGTGTTQRVALKHRLPCLSVELDSFYANQVALENRVPCMEIGQWISGLSA